MNEIENIYRLTKKERKQLITEMMPFLEGKSDDEIERALQRILLKSTNLSLNPLKSKEG